MSAKSTLTAALLACSLVSACGPAMEDEGSSLSIAKSMFAGFKSRSKTQAPTQAQIQTAAATALQNTDQPLALLQIPKAKAFAMILQIEQNGRNKVFATSDRRSLTLVNGMVVATRGFGDDLMSAETDSVLALVSARQTGLAVRVLRHLDGENQTVEQRLDCQIARGKRIQAVSGEINRPATQMTESCRSAQLSFQNRYVVDDQGRLVASSQWVSRLRGHFHIQDLR